MAIGDFLKNAKTKAEETKAKAEAAEVARAQFEQAAQAVLVTTGDIQAKYQPVKIVFAVGGSTGGLFKTASPQEAFEEAVITLKRMSAAAGGHAVVHCSFGYSAVQHGFVVHGYGTVVRLG